MFLNDMKASDISIKDLDCSSPAANELFNMLASIKMNDTGLKSLTISCPSSFEELDNSVLDRMALRCSNLESLEIKNVLSEKCSQSLAYLVERIFMQTPSLKELNLSSFCKDPEKAQKLMEPLT